MNYILYCIFTIAIWGGAAAGVLALLWHNSPAHGKRARAIRKRRTIAWACITIACAISAYIAVTVAGGTF